jgi:hypothetical protein
MPYIDQDSRKKYDLHIDQINKKFEQLGFNPGDIVYVMFRMVKFWWYKEPKFVTINSIRGVLNSTSVEFDRIVANPYEDQAMDRNGNIREK